MNASAAVQPNVSILALLSSERLLADLQQALGSQQYTLVHTSTAESFIRHLTEDACSIECLLVDEASALPSLFASLREANTLLPIVILAPSAASLEAAHELYHQAEVSLTEAEVAEIGDRVSAAIKQFLKLSPQETGLSSGRTDNFSEEPLSPASLLKQQQRLASKLKERLGYLGVYYKRNPKNFHHNLDKSEQRELMDGLKLKYQEILLVYFSDTAELNVLIDEFTNLAFFADISVTQIVEIHMKLIDDYSKQLKLEGRNEAILINYRLTLLDIISHLCEMYRRSIPRDS